MQNNISNNTEMGVLIQDPTTLSCHVYRATRRHAAIDQREQTLFDHKLSRAAQSSELAEWRRWWSGPHVAMVSSLGEVGDATLGKKELQAQALHHKQVKVVVEVFTQTELIEVSSDVIASCGMECMPVSKVYDLVERVVVQATERLEQKFEHRVEDLTRRLTTDYEKQMKVIMAQFEDKDRLCQQVQLQLDTLQSYSDERDHEGQEACRL